MIFVKESYVIGWDSQNLFNVDNHTHTYLIKCRMIQLLTFICKHSPSSPPLASHTQLLPDNMEWTTGTQWTTSYTTNNSANPAPYAHCSTTKPSTRCACAYRVLAPVLSSGWRSLPLPRLSSCLHPPVKTPSVLQQSPSRRASHSTLYLYNTYTFCVRDYVCCKPYATQGVRQNKTVLAWG